ncbi:sensor histidine kinase [Leeia aquatica]|uniref:histidine kinase n=1 Tax=Leeia aquatica TaxID=2725557 RepID=A0A847RZN9_9NEIS|nr:ATP-binding protein [Leeia aquatica]NLR76570.1 HAMP domain-containing protein [Leeia aquatica]
MKRLVILAALVTGIMLYLLASAAANGSRLSNHYNLLLLLNGVVAVGLLALVGWQLWDLRKKLKAGVFGSKLTLRLVLMFGLVAVLPGALVYTVSFQFLTRSIETWFDVRVDTALDRGLNLGQVALDHVRQEQERVALSIARQLNEAKDADLLSLLGRLREQQDIAQLGIFTSRGSLLAYAGSESPAQPAQNELLQARSGPWSVVENAAENEHELKVRVLVALKPGGLGGDGRMLLLQQPVSRQLADDAEVLENIRRDYKTLALSRGNLQLIYSVTLTLSLLLILLLVMALAFYLSSRLSAPLSVLAAGTRAVAQGDFSQRQTVLSKDELGVLTLQFNRMTRQLAEARDSVEQQQQALAAANEYLASLLANLTAGVLAFDAGFGLRSSNAGADAILGVPMHELQGTALAAWGRRMPQLAEFAQRVVEGFNGVGQDSWHAQLELVGPRGSQVLLLRGSRMPGAGHGFVLVFDDITDLMQAQRQAAWGEVARRLAHEIKNPLTPIQLSAERLQHKLSDKLAQPDADMLARSTQTIVNQVAALKNMVEDFKEYARAPKTVLQMLDLNALVREVLTLYESSGWVQARLCDRAVLVMGDATRLRQVLHNLLQNAQDAVSGAEAPCIEVRLQGAETSATLVVQDNGAGFPPDMLARVFEPYVTTKAKGTGLGLAIVKKICEEHHGSVSIQNREPQGASVTLVLPRVTTPPEGDV